MPEFHARLLLRPGYLWGRWKTLRSTEDLFARGRDLLILAAKLLTGRYGRAYWSARRRRRLEEYARLKDTHLADEGIHLRAADLYEREGRGEDALAAWARASAANPSNSMTRIRLGRTYLDRKDYASAARLLTELRSSGISSFELHRECARLWERTGKHRRALEETEHALRFRPDDAGIRTQRGRLLGSLGEHESALRELMPLIEKDPADPSACYAAAISFQSLGRHGRAAAACRKALEIDTREDEADRYFDAARHHQALGDHKSAVEYCRRAIGLDPRESGRIEVHGEAYLEFLANRALSEAECFRDEICLTKPVHLSVLLTNACNLSCVMCTRVRLRNDALRLAEVKRLEPFMPYCRDVHWEGGEVFLVNYLRELLEWFHEKHPWTRQSITTSGILIDKFWAELFAEQDMEMTFSIDSVVPESYESIRVGADFVKLQRNLDIMSDAYGRRGRTPRFEMNYVVMKRTIEELPLIPGFCRRFGIRRVNLDELNPEYAPQERIAGRDLERLRRLLPGVKEECREHGIRFDVSFATRLSALVEPQPPAPAASPFQASPAKGAFAEVQAPPPERPTAEELHRELTEGRTPMCAQPWRELHINFNGDAMPNCACSKPVGNLRADSPDELWNGPGMRAYRRELLGRGSSGCCPPDCPFVHRQLSLAE